MKRFSLLSVVVASLFFLTSCDTTREITLNENGSGKLVTTNDMSALITIAKMSGQNDKINGEEALDTTISLAKMADSISTLTPKEKELMKKGVMALNLDMANDKMLTKATFPFTSAEELSQVTSLSDKVLTEAISKQMGSGGGDAAGLPPGMGDMKGSTDEYYVITYGKGLIEKKLDKAKYAKVDDDQGIQGLKKAGEEGVPISNTIVYNLPRPAKKAEGKNVVLSEDKKKVTIKSTMEDFFDDATKLEFKIEY